MHTYADGMKTSWTHCPASGARFCGIALWRKEYYEDDFHVLFVETMRDFRILLLLSV